MWALGAQLLERGREGACGIWFQTVGEHRKALGILQGLRKTLWNESWGTWLEGDFHSGLKAFPKGIKRFPSKGDVNPAGKAEQELMSVNQSQPDSEWKWEQCLWNECGSPHTTRRSGFPPDWRSLWSLGCCSQFRWRDEFIPWNPGWMAGMDLGAAEELTNCFSPSWNEVFQNPRCTAQKTSLVCLMRPRSQTRGEERRTQKELGRRNPIIHNFHQVIP